MKMDLTSRRKILKALLIAAATPVFASLPGPGIAFAYPDGQLRHRKEFVRPSVATTTESTATPAFSENEATALALVVEAIVPADATPGARDTASVVFVMQTLQRYGVTAVRGIKQALASVDQIAFATYGLTFAALDETSRNAIVRLIAVEPSFALFWNTVRSLTVLHFYAQPAGYRPIGLPGPNIDRGGYPLADVGREQGCISL